MGPTTVFLSILIIFAVIFYNYPNFSKSTWNWFKTEIPTIGPVRKLLMVLFGIFSIVAIFYFIDYVKEPMTEKSATAAEALSQTGGNIFYGVLRGAGKAKDEHQKTTGNFIPSDIYHDGIKKINDSTYKVTILKGQKTGSWKVPEGFSTINITDFNGREIWCSKGKKVFKKGSGEDHDKDFQLGEYYFSSEPSFYMETNLTEVNFVIELIK